MGLDPLEISFRLEKRFGIRIRANTGFAFLTAGTLCDVVWQKLQGVEPGIPDFAELSQQIEEALPRAPGRRWWFQSASFESRMESGDLEDNWRRFQKSLHLSLQPLVHSGEANKLRLPPGFRTDASVTLWIVQNHPERITWLREPSTTERPPGAESITREECWQAVRDILADVLMLDPGQVVPEAHLIEDLGME